MDTYLFIKGFASFETEIYACLLSRNYS